ncbi:hypothetical protein JCM14076_20620 [Methylosoma difficile]
MLVVKLGGSLVNAKRLRDCLERLQEKYQGRAVVLVPGGGAFAEQVRLAQQQWQFDDRTAHAMALLAMQQMALLIHGLKPCWAIAKSAQEIRQLVSPTQWLVWSPDIAELDQAGIAASWDITSDSLAAWLAGALSAQELLLIKAAPVDASLSAGQLAALGLVDAAFCGFVRQAAYRINVMAEADL